jgi:hypothetical protein
MAKTQRKLTPQERGRKGGLTTLARHGRQHFVAAGKIGFDVTCPRHWAGDRAAYVKWLQERGYLISIDRAFTAKCAEAQASGETGPWCIEIPLLPSEEDELDLSSTGNPVVDCVLASIRSAPLPEFPL